MNNTKWSLEKCKEEALKYDTRLNFKKTSRMCYVNCCKNKWLDYVCLHMIKPPNKMKGYWNDIEKCRKEALKYDTRNTFRLNSKGCYQSSFKNKWLDEICLHMLEIIKPKKYWYNYELCREEALKYNNRHSFEVGCVSGYRVSKIYNWLDDFFGKNNIKPNNYWNNIEICKEEALKYNNKKDFSIYSAGAYHNSLKNKWLDEICTHMEYIGNRYHRAIYVIIFPKNIVYVGLSYNVKKRFIQHLNDKKSSVYKYFIDTNLKPVYKILTNYVYVKEAQELEKYYLEKYKKDGFTLLNKNKAGGVGNTIKKV